MERVLAVDVGNTNIVVGCFEGDLLLFTGRIPTKKGEQEDILYGALCGVLIEQGASMPLDGSVFSSVVPAVDGPLSAALQRLTGRTPVRACLHSSSGIRLGDYDTSCLGMDRVVDMTAARSLAGPHPVIVYDLGTCTTMSVVSADGVFLGGMISAGIQLSLDAQAQRAAQLPALRAEGPGRMIGRNTRECMMSGAVIGAAAMIDGVVDRVSEQLQAGDLQLVLTGGLGCLVVPWLRSRVIYEPDLLMKGLRILYTRNVQ